MQNITVELDLPTSGFNHTPISHIPIKIVHARSLQPLMNPDVVQRRLKIPLYLRSHGNCPRWNVESWREIVNALTEDLATASKGPVFGAMIAHTKISILGHSSMFRSTNTANRFWASQP